MMSITKNTFIIFTVFAAATSFSVDAAGGLRGAKQPEQSMTRNLQQAGFWDGIMNYAINQQAETQECWDSWTQEEREQAMKAISGQGGMPPPCDPSIQAKYRNESVEEAEQRQEREGEFAELMIEQAEQQAEQQKQQTAQIMMASQPGLTMEEALKQIDDFSNFGPRKLQQLEGLFNGLGDIFEGGFDWNGIAEYYNNQNAEMQECWDSWTQEEKEQAMKAISGQGGMPPRCDPSIQAKYRNESVEEAEQRQEREGEIAELMIEQAEQQAEQTRLNTAQIMMSSEPGLTMEEALKRIEEMESFSSF